LKAGAFKPPIDVVPIADSDPQTSGGRWLGGNKILNLLEICPDELSKEN